MTTTMTPITATPAQRVWGDESFIPDQFNPQEGEAWLSPVWAKFIDMKSVTFQPKEGISLRVAILHLEAVMNCHDVTLLRRTMAAGWLCSQWFESFEIPVDLER
jgi:hypothetical protein